MWKKVVTFILKKIPDFYSEVTLFINNALLRNLKFDIKFSKYDRSWAVSKKFIFYIYQFEVI